MQRVGIFICECGPNIRDALPLDELTEWAGELDHVAHVQRTGILCSDDGKDAVRAAIRDHELTHVVVAACSPKEHGHTFRKVLQEAGLNPFLLHMANIREQCAWVHKDRDRATEKAKSAIRAGVRRVLRQEPLETRRIDAQADVLVIGAGVAGISAALALAHKDRTVYLADRLPVVGGKVARYEEVFPEMECAPCMLDPKIDSVLHHPNIQTLLYSEVQEVLGFYGNFTVRLLCRARSVDVEACIGCSACVEPCPVQTRNEYNEGLDERKAIYMPYPGAMPNAAVIDRDVCVRFQGQECDACQAGCPFGAINYEQEDEVREIKVGAIVVATGFDTWDVHKAPLYGYGASSEVYTGLEFERLLSASGPTEGRLECKDGRAPTRIAFVHCAGSRDTEHRNYCSGICCTYLLKFAHLATKKLTDISVTHVYRDLCLPGKEAQQFHDDLATRDNVSFVQCIAPDSLTVSEKSGSPIVTCTTRDGKHEVEADMIVLATAMEGARGADAQARTLDVDLDDGRCVVPEHRKLAPVSTAMEGVFIAGCAQGPRDITDAVAGGQAAAGLILSRLVPGEKLTLETMISVVNEDVCSGCKTCLSLCPYSAITYDTEEKHTSVNEALCRGCGTCAATCPSGAIKARHFTDKQIHAELEGLLTK